MCIYIYIHTHIGRGGTRDSTQREEKCHTISKAARWGAGYIVVLHVGWEEEEDDEEGGGGGERGSRRREKGGEKRRVPFTAQMASSRLGRSSACAWELVSSVYLAGRRRRMMRKEEEEEKVGEGGGGRRKRREEGTLHPAGGLVPPGAFVGRCVGGGVVLCTMEDGGQLLRLNSSIPNQAYLSI